MADILTLVLIRTVALSVQTLQPAVNAATGVLFLERRSEQAHHKLLS